MKKSYESFYKGLLSVKGLSNGSIEITVKLSIAKAVIWKWIGIPQRAIEEISKEFPNNSEILEQYLTWYRGNND